MVKELKDLEDQDEEIFDNMNLAKGFGTGSGIFFDHDDGGSH